MAFPTQICNSISVRLDETNYPTWAFQMHHHLRGHGLLKFVDGSHPCPPQFLIGNDDSLTTDNTRAYDKWLEQDSLVISMIITALCVDALTLVIGCQTSMEVWLTLKERYAIISESHIMQLKAALQNIQKGSDSIDKYLLRFKYMKDRLAVAGVEMNDQDVKFLILAGLPSEYGHTRQVLRGKRDSTMNEVRSLLLSAEFEIELQNKALSLSYLTATAAQNGISNGSTLTASYGLPTGITHINAYNGQPLKHMSYIQPSASTGFISSSQASVGFSDAPISSTPGDTNFQANLHGTRLMSGNGSEFQSTYQNTPSINICTTMSQAPYIMHNTPSAVGLVNLSYDASQPTIVQQQSANNVSSASGFVAEYNNGNGAYLQFPNNAIQSDNGNCSKQHIGIQQQSTDPYTGNFSSNNGNTMYYSEDTVQNNYPQFTTNNNVRNGYKNNRNTNSGNYSKPSFNSTQGSLICQICEKPGHSASKCYHRNPQQQVWLVDMQKQHDECASAIFEEKIDDNDDAMLKVEAAVNAADRRRHHYGIQTPTCAAPKALSASICTQPQPPSIATQPTNNPSRSQVVKPNLQQALLRKIEVLQTLGAWLLPSTPDKNVMNCRQACESTNLWQPLPLIPPG